MTTLKEKNKHIAQHYANVLKNNLSENDTIHYLTMKTSRTGMSRNMKFYVISEGFLIDITYYIGKLNINGSTLGKDDTCIVKGFGMDLGQAIVSRLSKILDIELNSNRM
jgi:hypothetical protein